MERRVPFQEHVGQLSLSLLCHWGRTALKLHSCYCYSNESPRKKRDGGKKNDVCMHTYTYTHWLHAAKAYLQCSQEVKQSGVVVGGGARAAVCEIEAPDVSQGLSRAMGRNGKIIKRQGRRGAQGETGDFTRSHHGNIFKRA